MSTHTPLPLSSLLCYQQHRRGSGNAGAAGGSAAVAAATAAAAAASAAAAAGGGGTAAPGEHQPNAELYRTPNAWGTEREKERQAGGGGREPEQLPEHVFAIQMAKNQPWRDRLTVRLATDRGGGAGGEREGVNVARTLVFACVYLLCFWGERGRTVVV